MADTSAEHTALFGALAVHFQFVSSDVLAGTRSTTTLSAPSADKRDASRADQRHL